MSWQNIAHKRAVWQTTPNDDHCRSMYRYAEAHIKGVKNAKLIMSFDISNQIFLNWLFFWGLDKELFSLNWKEEWNKEIYRSKKKKNNKKSPFKTQVIF